ncbi:MAG: YajG family lipoprotein [Gammaproteobacteria bacterium]|nr:YajG family lipoprotein [Gammaproteobacteria bacterium]MDX2459026.1 YajG family lipoprotein [Gammaproteobacteria bacterium]
MATEVKLSAAVEAICTKGGDTLSSRFRTNHNEEFAFAPDDAKNSELINMVLGKSLDQMLADSQLRDFMSK